MGFLDFAVHHVTVAVVAFGLMLNSFAMMFSPPLWYSIVYTVPETGPLNKHFVRDVGIAFFCSSVALLWAKRGGGWRCAALGAMFVVLHSFLHAIELVCFGMHKAFLLEEVVTVHAPSLLAFGEALALFMDERRQRK